MYYSAIGVLAILILFIVNWDVLHKSQVYDKPAWIVYRRFLFAVVAYYVTDVLWGVLEYKKLSTALFVDTTVYFMAMAVGLSFWAEYTVAYLNEKNNTFGKALVYSGRIAAALIICLNIANIFAPVLFTVDSKSVYTAMPLRYVVLASQILLLLIISFHSLTSMFHTGFRAKKNRRFRILASFGLIMALCLFIQLWFPYLPIYSIAYMLGTCLLHAFVANDEKEEYERELQEAGKVSEMRDRLFAVLDNMPGMTFTKDAQTGRYLACNQAFADYAHKKDPDSVLGLTDADMFDAETAAHFVEADRIALSLSKPYIFHEDVLDANGNPRQLQTTKLRYKDTMGRACVLGMCQDVTDLVSVQHEQAMTKEAYESAVNQGLMYNHIAQTLARDYTEMFYVNTDTEEFTQYRKGDDGGEFTEVRRGWHFFSDIKTELSEGAYPDDKDTLLLALNRKRLMKALCRKNTFDMSYRRTIHGKPVYFSMKISKMENDEQFIIIVFMDVDAQIREAMAKNEALSDALSSAEAANRSKMTFLAGMSHEIRTPINAIIGLDTLALKNKDIDDATKDYLRKIGDSAHDLLSIINNVLNMSRIESGREFLHSHEFSLGSMLGQIGTQIEPKFAEKGVSFESSIPGETDDHYIGDDARLREVLIRILTKLIGSAERSGCITLTAEKTAEYKDQATLRFCIKDTGLEIGRENIPTMFDELSQQGGAGRELDLAVTKKIVELMNGTINVESGKDIGTVFTVMVTLHKGSGKEKARKGELDTNALFILIVDDNPIEAQHAEMVLEDAGIRADICTNGSEALRKMQIQHAQGKPYNMVLMDWSMPGMNGTETSEEILRLYGKESIVVAMTAYNWDDIRDEARSVGVQDYIEKPLHTASIIEDLKRIAHRSDMAVLLESKKARLEGRRILLAEDVDINAEIMTDMLDMENIKADRAENGKIAVELFEKSTAGIYSAILMDVRMPQMDGLEAAKAIRAMDREDAKRIPIIALTANAFDEDIQLSLQAGMNAHLNKPVEADHLIRILGELIYESEQKITGK